MSNKVTLQDIADALGLSRNTVSRAINNSDSIAEATKKKIFQIKAQDIEAIYIKRGKWYSLLVFFIQTIFATLAEEDTMSSFSIVFKRCEIIKTEKRDTVSPSLKGNSCPDMFEYCDIMSVRKCKKLCKMIGVIPRFVDR